MSQVSRLHLSKDNVPEYLHDSQLYQSFSDEPGDIILVPKDCLKRTVIVDTFADLKSLLQTARFWLLDIFPRQMVKFLVQSTFCATKFAGVTSILQELCGYICMHTVR